MSKIRLTESEIRNVVREQIIKELYRSQDINKTITLMLDRKEKMAQVGFDLNNAESFTLDDNYTCWKMKDSNNIFIVPNNDENVFYVLRVGLLGLTSYRAIYKDEWIDGKWDSNYYQISSKWMNNLDYIRRLIDRVDTIEDPFYS